MTDQAPQRCPTCGLKYPGDDTDPHEALMDVMGHRCSCKPVQPSASESAKEHEGPLYPEDFRCGGCGTCEACLDYAAHLVPADAKCPPVAESAKVCPYCKDKKVYCPHCGRSAPTPDPDKALWWAWQNPKGKWFVIKEGVEESWAVLDEQHGNALAARFDEYERAGSQLPKVVAALRDLIQAAMNRGMNDLDVVKRAQEVLK